MKHKIVALFCFFLVGTAFSMAQTNLNVNDVFDRYGKQEGSVLVQLASDILSQGGSKITFYKSLIIDDLPHIKQDIQNAIKADVEGKIIISEVKKNGQIESCSYYLGKDKSSKSEFILYSNKGRKITVVYLKGNFSPAHLDNELKKLKDLFIYVNNKRLKIQ